MIDGLVAGGLLFAAGVAGMATAEFIALVRGHQYTPAEVAEILIAELEAEACPTPTSPE